MTDLKQQKKKPQKQYVDLNPVEAFRDLGAGVAQSVAKDLGKDAVSDLWDQLLGQKAHGDLYEGEEIDLSARAERKPAYVEPGIDYQREIVHGEERIAKGQEQYVQAQIEQIIVELRQLVTKSTELEVEFREVSIQTAPAKAGKYHINFFTWLLATVRTARMRVEDSASWLSMFSSKKAQRGYWNMFKKHGTTFGLSNERVVATQAG